MFKLKKPCVNCPFKRGLGEKFALGEERVMEIVKGSAFQCHKTVDYSTSWKGRPGEKPQQCAGLMSLLHKIDRPNQMMQIAQRLRFEDFNPDNLDHSETYDTLEEALEAHR